jgi:hypothetical protein
MQIRIEIDVKPEELRRFLGLPDVAGLQEDVIQFLREKVGAASESFDPASFVKENLQTLRRSSAWQKIIASTKISRAAPTPAAEPTAPAKAKTARKSSARKTPGLRAAPKRKSADHSPEKL